MINQTLVAPFELKQLDGETGVFEGMAAVFNNRDAGDDIILPGAFSATLKKLPPSKIKMLWQHDPREPIGVWLEAEERSAGLWAKGRLLDVQRGREAHVLLKAGALDGLSIGYTADTFEIDKASGVRKLIDVTLFEISPVTFPMNDQALVTRVKAGAVATARDYEKFLRDSGFPRRFSQAVTIHGFNEAKNLLRREGDPREELAELVASLERATDRLTHLTKENRYAKRHR